MIAIGDIVASLLERVGITKARVSRLTGTADCGCDQRQAAMNAFGYRVQRWLFARCFALTRRLAVLLRTQRGRRIVVCFAHLRDAVVVLWRGV